MGQSAPATQYAREKLRSEINRHIKEFIDNGGAIELISNHAPERKVHGSVWPQALPPVDDL